MVPTHNLRGILAMLGAVGALSVMDVGLKLLAAHYPPLQVAALRGAASVPFVVAWVIATGQVGSLWRVRWPLHLFRGVLAVMMMGAFAYALRELPLSTIYTLFFVAPLLITALSVPVLGETVGPRRWIAIVVGLLGVLVVLRPAGEGVFTLAGVAVLCASTGYAVSAVTTRVLARTDTTQSMVFWMIALMTLGATLLAAPGWRALDAAHWGLVAGVGLAGAIGQWAFTEAFRHGEASAIAPFEYTALAWGLAFDLALWGVLPDAVTWLGAAIIIGSGLYVIRREHLRARAGSA